MSRAVAAARTAFDDGPWPRLTHAERAEYLRALGDAHHGARPTRSPSCGRASRACSTRSPQYGGRSARASLRAVRGARRHVPVRGGARAAGGGEFGLLVREPVGVVGAIIPWNAPLGAHLPQDRPRAARRLHRRAQVVARGARRGLRLRRGRRADRPAAGRAQRRDRRPRGVGAARARPAASTRSRSRARPRPAGASRRSAASGSRAARSSSAASRPRSILDDIDLGTAATTLAKAECVLTGQVCSSLTRIIVTRKRHDELVDALAASFGKVRVGDPFDEKIADGAARRRSASATASRATSPRASTRARRSRPAAAARRISTAATSSSRPCSATSTTRRRSRRRRSSVRCSSVIPADDEQDAVRIANDTIYGLNASVFTNDVDRARAVAGELRAGHRRPQRVPHRLRHRVRRLQAVGHRSRGRQGRPAALPRDQDRDPRRAPRRVRHDDRLTGELTA